MENLNGKFGHVIDNELHCSELEIGMVYFIDYGNNPNLLTSVNKFIDDFKKNGESSFMLFKYEVKVLSAEDMPSSLADKRDMTFGRDFNLVTPVPPFCGNRRLFVHLLTDDKNVYSEISNFIFSADKNAASELKSKFITLAMQYPERAIDFFEGEDGLMRLLRPLYSFAGFHLMGIVKGLTPGFGDVFAEEKKKISDVMSSSMKQMVDGNITSQAQLRQILENINPHELVNFYLEKISRDGYTASQKDIPYLVDMVFGHIQTQTKACVIPEQYTKGTIGSYIVKFENKEFSKNITMQFKHRESAVVYIMLLIARLNSKNVDVRVLLEKNKAAFIDILKKVYGLPDKSLYERYDKMVYRKINETIKSKSESKLKQCRSDINGKVHSALVDFDSPYPFLIDHREGHLLIPENNIVLPEQFRAYPLI